LAHNPARSTSRPGGAERAGAAGAGDGGRDGAPANAAGSPSGRVSARPVSAPIPDGDASQGGGGSAPAAYVAGGLAALVMALAAGFLWYRRRLP
ncbi:MAG: hypothetical protein ACRDMH_13300, partial [Solirubrobacterales bacterium]